MGNFSGVFICPQNGVSLAPRSVGQLWPKRRAKTNAREQASESMTAISTETANGRAYASRSIGAWKKLDGGKEDKVTVSKAVPAVVSNDSASPVPEAVSNEARVRIQDYRRRITMSCKRRAIP
jgi:hypothetical protein